MWRLTEISWVGTSQREGARKIARTCLSICPYIRIVLRRNKDKKGKEIALIRCFGMNLSDNTMRHVGNVLFSIYSIDFHENQRGSTLCMKNL